MTDVTLARDGVTSTATVWKRLLRVVPSIGSKFGSISRLTSDLANALAELATALTTVSGGGLFVASTRPSELPHGHGYTFE